MKQERKNLLFIMTDHQRYDTIRMIQCGKEVTPNLNKLAKEGACFERAYTSCPLCVPARTALATGIYPVSSGVVYNDWKNKTACKAVCLQDILKNNGYRVGHVGVDHIKVRPPMRERKLDFFCSHVEYEEWAKQRGRILKDPEDITWIKEKCGEEIGIWGYSGVRISQWENPLEEFKDIFFCNQAIKFLDAEDERPFALFLYLWAPHPPLKIPKPYASMYEPSKLNLPANIGTPSQDEPVSRRSGAAAQLAEGVSQNHWREIWAAYLGLTTLADDIIGRILAKVDAIGQRNHTVTIFTSDHGDNLGQHSMYQKMEMYEECIHIPLLIRLPGCSPVIENKLVCHLDLVPTICDLIGENFDGFEGISLLDAVKGDEIPARDAVFSQYSGTYGYGFIRRAVILEKEKYVYDDWGGQEYYRLNESPDEMVNLAGKNSCQERVGELHQICRSYHQEHGDYFEWDRRRGKTHGEIISEE